MADKLIFLAAGGTGGHLFPAEALAHELKARGYAVHLVTDSRAERYAGKFPAEEIHIVPSATLASKNPIAVAKTAWTLWRGLTTARRILSKYRPAAIVGFGGYPTVPPLMSAVRFNIASIIHEQNAVMGRANKALAPRVKAIAGGFLPETGGTFATKTVTTGNPVRPAVIEASLEPYTPSRPGEPFHLVVFGGSQGAQFFSNAIPAAIALLPADLKARLRVTQQARAEDKDGVIAAYKSMGIPAEVSPFFTDMAARIATAHLVISRSGASTVSELSAIGRPSVLVPYPYALDHDQAANAAALAKTGGAEVIKQADLSPERLCEIITSAMNEPARLSAAAASAKLAGRPEATTELADLVVAIATGQTVEQFKTNRNNKGARP